MSTAVFSRFKKINTIISISGLFFFFLLMIFQNLVKGYFGNEYLFIGYFLGVVLLVYLFIVDFIRKGTVKIHDLDRFLIFFIIIQLIWALPTFFSSPRAAVIGFMYNARNFFIPYALVRFSYLGSFNKKWLIRWMVFLIFLVAVYGIYQYYFDWERFLGISVATAGFFYSEGRRAYSFLLTPLDLAFSSMIMGIVMFSYLIEKNKIFSLLTHIFLFLIFTVSTILTFTRSAYIGFVLGIFVVLVTFLLKIRVNIKLLFIILLFIIILIGIGWGLFPDFFDKIIRLEDSSAIEHISNFQQGIRVFLQNPLGLGLGKSGWTVVNWNVGGGIYVESAIQQVMVESGIIGIIAFILFFGKIILISISNYFKNENPIFLGVLGATVGIFAGSFFLPVYYFSTAMSFYWGLVAISIFYREGAQELVQRDLDKRWI